MHPVHCDRSALIGDISRAMSQLAIPQTVQSAILSLLGHYGDVSLPPVTRTLTVGEIARSFHKASLRRSEVLGHKLVADMAWNMLLDLFASQEEGRRVSVTSLCIASGGPPTTALRHLDRLEAKGLVRRLEDQADGRRIWVEATVEATTLMRKLIASFVLSEDHQPF